MGRQGSRASEALIADTYELFFHLVGLQCLFLLFVQSKMTLSEATQIQNSFLNCKYQVIGKLLLLIATVD